MSHTAMYPDVFDHPLPLFAPNVHYAVPRSLVIDFCGQSHYYNTDPTITQPGFDLLRYTWWSPTNRFRTSHVFQRDFVHIQ